MGALSIEEVLIAEVAAIHGEEQWDKVQEARPLSALTSAASSRARSQSDIRSGTPDPTDPEDSKRFYRALNKLNRAALCCSGGGIRSATFCLGVIQALARHQVPTTQPGGGTPAEQSLLNRFHYLSTVSGGGYIGSWLSAWLARADFPTVWADLTGRPLGPDVEPPEISWLRAYSNYLTPRVGLASADTWSGVALFLRNLLLNWLVIVPAIALVLLALKAIATISVAVARIGNAWWPPLITLLLAVALLVVAQAFTTRNRPTRRVLDRRASDGVDQRTFLRGDLLWSFLSAILMTSFLTSRGGMELAANTWLPAVIIVGGILGMIIFLGGWLAGRSRWEPGDLFRWAASGFIYGAMLGIGAHLFALLSPYTEDLTIWTILVPVIFGVPWVLTAELFAEMIFVGLVSYEPGSDADREWLGRGAGWNAASAVGWGLTTLVTFALANLLIGAYAWLGPYIASAGGIAGIIGAFIGQSSSTSAKPGEEDKSFKALALKIGLAIAGPIFAIALIVSISVGLDLLLLGGSLVRILTSESLGTGYILLQLFLAAIVIGLVAWVASRTVNINRFSLHALYRNRLIRAYLGASRQTRHPDAFTGFDDEDNLPVSELWPPRGERRKPACLFHVVNITLNVVQSQRLAWQQRKAESFTVSPLHSGAAYKGFRPSSEYGHKISLGTALAISGAAASPNMGYNSSPSITLLLSLFNVRLGWWLGNPGPEGERTYKEEGPRTAIRPLAEETFGLTTDDKPYVYLSDGGHFENLGLYEMVRRRCRFIVAIDAGCDPDFAFEDLGNALRKIFIDLGVRIHFDGLKKISNRRTVKTACEPSSELRTAIPYCAIGTIDYESADGSPSACNGYILYIKPAYHGTEGAGIVSYATANPTFPHETTADQFFTESQFESYRSLGLDIMNSILDDSDQGFEKAGLKAALAGLGTT